MRTWKSLIATAIIGGTIALGTATADAHIPDECLSIMQRMGSFNSNLWNEQVEFKSFVENMENWDEDFPIFLWMFAADGITIAQGLDRCAGEFIACVDGQEYDSKCLAMSGYEQRPAD